MDKQFSVNHLGRELRDQRNPFLSRIPFARTRRWIAFTAAIALPLLALIFRFLVADFLPEGYPFITFFPAVIITAFFFGLRPGVVAGVLSGLLSWFFFISPVYSFDLSFNAIVALGFYAAIISVDIALVHWMQDANCELTNERQRANELAENREVLFKELQHRVGNNLQMVGSLIALQKRRMNDPAAKVALDEAARRLGLVGRIQRQLYDPAGAQLSLAAYIDQICKDVIAAAGREGLRYDFTSVGDAVLPPDKAIPTALVVAEAVNNAIEHGFGSGNEGHIQVAVAPVPRGVAVTIADNGKGIPAGFDVNASESLGLKIARTLAQSLGGRFSMHAAPLGAGTVATLEIAAEMPQPAV